MNFFLFNFGYFVKLPYFCYLKQSINLCFDVPIYNNIQSISKIIIYVFNLLNLLNSKEVIFFKNCQNQVTISKKYGLNMSVRICAGHIRFFIRDKLNSICKKKVLQKSF